MVNPMTVHHDPVAIISDNFDLPGKWVGIAYAGQPGVYRAGIIEGDRPLGAMRPEETVISPAFIVIAYDLIAVVNTPRPCTASVRNIYLTVGKSGSYRHVEAVA